MHCGKYRLICSIYKKIFPVLLHRFLCFFPAFHTHQLLPTSYTTAGVYIFCFCQQIQEKDQSQQCDLTFLLCDTHPQMYIYL